MKNLFSISNFSRTSQEGRFLSKIEAKEIIDEDSKLQEIDKAKLETDTKKDLLNAEVKISSKNVDVAKTSVEEDIDKLSDKELEIKVKEYVMEPFKKDPKFREILENKEQTPAEMFSALNNYAEIPEVEHKFKEHMKVIPNGWKDNLRIGGILGTIGFISHDGNIKESSLKAVKWAAIGAALTHPIVTGTASHVSKFLGKNVVAPGLILTGNLITNAVDNPMFLLEKFKESFQDGNYKDPANTPIWQLLRHNTTVEANLGKALSTSQNPIYLQSQGMKFSPELDGVITFMKNYKEGGNGGINSMMNNVENAAKFVTQTQSIEISDEELEKFRGKLWNEEAIPADERRQVIAINLKKEIEEFFRSKEELKDVFEIEKNKAEENKDIQQLKKSDLDELIGKGQDFAKLDKKLPHGIRRIMKNPTGGALIFYLLTFFLTKTAMGVKGLFQKETYEKMWENKSKVGKAIVFIPNKMWEGMKSLVGQSSSQKKRKKVLEVGKMKEGENWNKEQVKAYEELPKETKNKIAEKLFKKTEERSKYIKDEIKKKTDEIKDKNALKKDIEKIKKDNQGFKDSEFKGFFSGVDDKIMEKLFP